jgi:peptidoglycan/LPS O-acetylase OafA/YrhL
VTTAAPAPVPHIGAANKRFRRRDLPLVDGYRGAAAGAVLLYHASVWAGLMTHPTLGAFLARLGNYGVTVFFLISGLVLYLPFVKADLDDIPYADWRNFLWRRFLRIYPAYWVAITALFFVFGRAHPGGLTSLIGTYSLFDLYWRGAGAGGGLIIAWTLTIELSFYLVLPLLARALRAFARRVQGGRPDGALGYLVGLGILYVLGVAFRVVVLALVGRGAKALLWLPAYLDWFALGMALAVGVAWVDLGRRIPRVVAWLARQAVLCWLLAFALYWALVSLNGPLGLDVETASFTMARFLLAGSSALFLLLPGVYGDQERGLGATVFGNAAAQGAGAISYGIYLWHTIWIAEIVKWIRHDSYPRGIVPILATAVFLTAPTAALSYRLVETPARRLRTLVSPRRRRRQSMSHGGFAA